MAKKTHKIITKKLSNADKKEYTADYILCKALDIGENIIRCGGEPNRIEDTVTRICSAYGAAHTDVFALPSLIIAGVRMKDGTTSSQVRRVYNTDKNMHSLDALNDISRKLCSGEVSIDELDELIKKAVNTQPFNKYVLLIAGMLAAGGFAVFFGGTLLDGCAAAIAGLVVSAFNLCNLKIGNKMLYTVVASFVGAISALGVVRLGLGDNIDMVMIGTIMLLIPGLAFGSAVRDLLFGDTVSGVIQFTQAILTAVMVAFGFIVAILVFGGVFG